MRVTDELVKEPGSVEMRVQGDFLFAHQTGYLKQPEAGAYFVDSVLIGKRGDHGWSESENVFGQSPKVLRVGVRCKVVQSSKQ